MSARQDSLTIQSPSSTNKSSDPILHSTTNDKRKNEGVVLPVTQPTLIGLHCPCH